ncbi:hypothetical protein P3522_18225, partial [Vibrio parahaemolyticus]|nr:hypothetical protein [Vibrio parahaemolyticus]
PNAQRPTPNAQRPTPNAQRPTPNAQPFGLSKKYNKEYIVKKNIIFPWESSETSPTQHERDDADSPEWVGEQDDD